MEMKMEVSFSDGSTLSITRLQFMELKRFKLSGIKKHGIDDFKMRILNYMRSSRKETTVGHIVSAFRCYESAEIVNAAVESLVKDNLIKSIESFHKYNKKKTVKIFLV